MAQDLGGRSLHSATFTRSKAENISIAMFIGFGASIGFLSTLLLVSVLLKDRLYTGRYGDRDLLLHILFVLSIVASLLFIALGVYLFRSRFLLLNIFVSLFITISIYLLMVTR